MTFADLEKRINKLELDLITLSKRLDEFEKWLTLLEGNKWVYMKVKVSPLLYSNIRAV